MVNDFSIPIWQRCVAAPGNDGPFPTAFPLGQASMERRRRPLTFFFGFFIAFLLLGIESRWPRDGVVRELMFLSGICLAPTGALGRTWCHLFISGYKTKVLVQTGPYSMCRNPLYFFSAIGMIGIGLCSGTFAVPAIMALFFSVYYPWIIHCEEERLFSNHPLDYEEFWRTTPAFWPRVFHYREPETYTIFPSILRRNIADSFWFIALAAAAHVVSQLQETDLLPTLLEVW